MKRPMQSPSEKKCKDVKSSSLFHSNTWQNPLIIPIWNTVYFSNIPILQVYGEFDKYVS